MHQPPDNAVLLHDAGRRRWLLFRDPVAVLRAATPGEVAPLLHEVSRAVDRGALHAAGFISYEASPAFDPAQRTRPPDDFPLAWFGLYAGPVEVPSPDAGATLPAGEAADWQPSMSAAAYRRALARVHEHIGAGDTYQVNVTLRLRAAGVTDPWGLFGRMLRAQGPGFAGWVSLPEWAIGCASPELFFRQDGDGIESRPMKGTAPRGLWPDDDRGRARWLRRSSKNRAENVMIVDMVRNDLGRIARPGSVHVPRRFDVECYPTVWQMTSTVVAATGATFPEIVAALFPAASITGAPKVRTMGLIADLEDSPRRLYTGTLGYLSPGRQAQFNVAIRTVLTDRRNGRAEYGVGGGIVWDSKATSEAAEWATKARVLRQDSPDFSLLETLLWTPGAGYALLEPHLARLAASAEYFGRPCPLAALRDRLAAAAADFAVPQRVRLLLAASGAVTLEASALQPLPRPYRLCLARQPVASTDRFLYHKTTLRQTYQDALAARPGFTDVLLWNARGELTESCLANLVVELDGAWVTPPLRCGLLPGTCRAELLANGQIRERVVRVADLPRCTRVRLANSVRGLWDVEVVAAPPDSPSPAGLTGPRGRHRVLGGG